MTLTDITIAHHRHSISGADFHVVAFRWDDEGGHQRQMLAAVSTSTKPCKTIVGLLGASPGAAIILSPHYARLFMLHVVARSPTLDYLQWTRSHIMGPHEHLDILSSASDLLRQAQQLAGATCELITGQVRALVRQLDHDIQELSSTV